MSRTIQLLLFAFLGLGAASSSSAGTIEIALQFLDLAYDGTSITDAGSPADELDAVTFRVDGTTVGSITSDISADISIPVAIPVPTLSPGSSTATSGSGFFNLQFGSDFLDLDINEVTVTFIDAVTANFVFGAELSSSISGQALPFGLVIGTPVEVSFSAQVADGTLMDNGSFITNFEASGSGEVQGRFVPEPGTILIACLAAVITAAVRCRYRWG